MAPVKFGLPFPVLTVKFRLLLSLFLDVGGSGSRSVSSTKRPSLFLLIDVFISYYAIRERYSDRAVRYDGACLFIILSSIEDDMDVMDMPSNAFTRFTPSILAEMIRYASYKFHHHRLRLNMRKYEAPLHPFKILFVPPSCVERFTGRVYPPWQNDKRLFGSVRSGEWDVTPPTAFDRDYSGTPPYLYSGDKFSESIVHQSLENHFVHNFPWQDTRIVREALRLVNEPGFVWNCSSEQEIWEKCNEIDQLYNDVKATGKLDVELTAKDEEELPLSILTQMTNHILVDIARDGELLFVEGRHRLSIAKILEVDLVPVTVCVRHRKWMERRDQIYSHEKSVTHPDFSEWGNYGEAPIPPLLSEI